MAVLGLDRQGSADVDDWIYTDAQSFRIRSNTDVDSGEDHRFDYPIAVNIDSARNDAAEVRTYGYEIDGAGSTSSKAQNMHDKLRKSIERHLAPGRPYDAGLALYDFSPRTGRGLFGSANDLLWVDTWHVDLTDPLAGGYEPPAADYWTIERRRQRKGILTPTVELFDREADFRVERRIYRARVEGYTFSEYRFDVRYAV